MGIGVGGVNDVLGRHAGDLFGPFRRPIGHGRGKNVETFGALFDEMQVGQLIADDDVGDGVEHGYVAAGALPQMEMGELGQFDLARVE